MADPIAPAAICAGGLPCILVLQALGMDPIDMLAGLAGVVMVQAFMAPKKEEPKADLKRIVLAGSASMIMAAWGGPAIAAFVTSATPDDWKWIKDISEVRIKAMSAGIAGGFAQPIFLMIASMIKKRAPRESTESQ